MPWLKKHPHLESHSASRGLLLRNIILGGQDGVVNVLGIVLGVAIATGSNGMVLLAGLGNICREHKHGRSGLHINTR